MNDPGTFDNEFRDPAIFNQALAQWEASKSGPVSLLIVKKVLRMTPKFDIATALPDYMFHVGLEPCVA